MVKFISWLIKDALGPLSDRIEKVTEFFETFLNTLEDYNGRLRAVEKKTEDAWQRSLEAEAAVNGLSLRISNAIDYVYKLSQQLDDTVKQLETLEEIVSSNNSRFRVDIDDVEDVANSSAAAVKEMARLLDACDSSIRELTTRVSTLDRDLSQITKE